MNIFKSDAKQDQFVANMLYFKKNGSYIDVGSAFGELSNNTFFFESLGWKGACIEIDRKYNETYKNRTCKYINENALILDYKQLFESVNMPKDIDYASIDIDELSYSTLINLPFDDYKFKIITIEHDFYLHGDKFKRQQKQFLLSKGYVLLCENVYVEQEGFEGEKNPFEDWWVYPSFFEESLLNKIKCIDMYPSEIIDKFKI